MSYTTHKNFGLLPSGAVNWPQVFNANFNKLEQGDTVKRVTAVDIDQYECFYIDSDGKAALASNTTPVTGIWYSTGTTSAGAEGYGQIEGLIVKTTSPWTWNEGVFLYSDANGVLTETVSKSGIPVAYTIAVSTILVLSLRKLQRLGIKTLINTDSPYAPLETDEIILCDASSGAIIVNLPASSSKQGKEYCIVKTDSSINTVTIEGNASETINGDLTRVLTYQYESLNPISNNTNWITHTPNIQGIILTAPVDNASPPIIPTRTGKKFFHVKDVDDDLSITCPVITSAAFGRVISTAVGGAITERAEFIVSYNGIVTLLTDVTANVVANADTDTKLCIGTAATQEPLLIKNRLGSQQSILVILEYD